MIFGSFSIFHLIVPYPEPVLGDIFGLILLGLERILPDMNEPEPDNMFTG